VSKRAEHSYYDGGIGGIQLKYIGLAGCLLSRGSLLSECGRKIGHDSGVVQLSRLRWLKVFTFVFTDKDF
jgi:hypothetical protein